MAWGYREGRPCEAGAAARPAAPPGRANAAPGTGPAAPAATARGPRPQQPHPPERPGLRTPPRGAVKPRARLGPLVVASPEPPRSPTTRRRSTGPARNGAPRARGEGGGFPGLRGLPRSLRCAARRARSMEKHFFGTQTPVFWNRASREVRRMGEEETACKRAARSVEGKQRLEWLPSPWEGRGSEIGACRRRRRGELKRSSRMAHAGSVPFSNAQINTFRRERTEAKQGARNKEQRLPKGSPALRASTPVQFQSARVETRCGRWGVDRKSGRVGRSAHGQESG
eukprot:gene1015-biopygen10319